MSRFDMVRRWLLNLLAWSALLIGAGALGARLPIALAIPAWVAAAGVLCAAGALLIKSQPPGKPTMGGRTGYLVTHFGFRAGQGRLASAAAISWGVWTVVGVG
ncbi:MAG TPA: hypothetical protein VFF65_10800, partial [Phycisphaerales bacterium]|nr:hypothetical protein [Phycisphaerales bacterium]